MTTWGTKSLADLCEINIGRTPARGEPSYWGDGKLWLSIADMNQGRDLRRTKEQITNLAAQRVMPAIVSPGTVAMSFKLSIGKVGIVRKPMYTNEAIVTLPIKDKSIISPDFLYWVLRSIDVAASSDDAAKGRTLNKAKISRIQIPVPPLDEQWRVVEVLDSVDSVRFQRRDSIDLLDRLAQSMFVEMFGDPVQNEKGWPRAPLSSVLDRIDSGRSPVCLDRPAEAGEWGILKLGAVTSCEYIAGENKALSDLSAVDPGNEVHVGDVLFSRKNTKDLVGASAIVTETPSRLLMPDLIFRLVLKSGTSLDKWYLHRLLTHPGKRLMLQGLARGSAGSMPNISKSRLMEFQVELPPLELQREFADRIGLIRGLKSRYQLHSGELDTLFASLQQRAFAGDL